MVKHNEIDASSVLIFFVNGKKIIDTTPDPEQTLLSYLRENLRLCGTKLGCGEGGCGACTVMVSKYNHHTKIVQHYAVNACLMPVCAAHGLAIITVEGIGSIKTKLHPVQERIAKAHGSQCGFCTPGFVMSMYALLRSSPYPTMKEMEIAFQGNLCRCTGYRPIIEGYRTFTKEYQMECAMGDKCCKKQGNSTSDITNISNELFERSEFMPYDSTQEPIFPPELKTSSELNTSYLIFESQRVKWLRPKNLPQILDIKASFSNAKIITGNTEVGIEMKIKNMHYPMLISPVLVTELNELYANGDGIYVGAAVTLNDLNEFFQKKIGELPEYKTQIFSAIVDMLEWFAGKQIRNVASIGGNIMTGSPISDLCPILMAADVLLEVSNRDKGSRKLKMDETFFTGYRQNVIKPDEMLVSILIPYTHKNQHFLGYKQAKRREDDIAIVNAAFNVCFENDTSDKIVDMKMAFGGMAPTTIMAVQTAQKSIGHKWNNELIEFINPLLADEIPLEPSAPGGMILYRRTLTISLFFKAYLNILKRLKKPIPLLEQSGYTSFHALPPKSTQVYEIVKNREFHDSPLGQPKVHVSAYKQATGEAVYCDDTPRYENELYMSFVLSTRAHANILSIDANEALNDPGVHAFYSAKDLTQHQLMVGPIFHDEEIFVSKTVTSQGQIIGAIVADTQTIAFRASRKVKVVYEDLSPVIITIEDAIKHGSFHKSEPTCINRGDVDKAFAEADNIVEGECRMGGQEHFYLETHASIAIPKDPDEIEVISSTQHPSETQKLIAHVLGIPLAKVNVKVKRMGGGFGGKESRSMLVACPLAIAAYRLGRPVRYMLNRDEDMMISGTRHPFYFKYKAACNKDGLILGCEIQIYNNAGYSFDLSSSILDRALFHCTNAYYIPNVRSTGWVCKTNLPSNTAFRGFGGPQGMFLGEHVVRDIARVCGKKYHEVAEMNLFKAGDSTHYNQIMDNSNIRRCWNETIVQSNYYQRSAEVQNYNMQHRWKKRGISMVPTNFGIAYTALFLNQTGALVHVYTDGSVLLSHGGTEMGQGLHTKMIQVAANCLQIPTDRIHISETGTDKVPNTSATAASSGSDLNGMAILNACQQILKRLEKFKHEYPTEGWDLWVSKAYFNRISLSAVGFYATPEIGYDVSTNTGKAFNYFTPGAACSEVEIDCLTGDHRVIRTDIVMDLGSSLNPAIDIGQIEGGFIQGYGLFTMEEMIYSPTGTLFSRGPGAYKIPGYGDIPAEFNVSLLTGAPNPKAVYSSKAVGEPPLFLGSSIFFAIKEAVVAARRDENLNDDFKFPAPATSARIRMACMDNFTRQFKEPDENSFTPWNVVP